MTVLCWQNNELLFRSVLVHSPSTAKFVATALRRREQKGGWKMAGGSGLTRGTVALTHRSIEALRPAEAPYRLSDQRCIGLAVRVPPSGIKTWDLAYRIRGSGKVRRISLGRVADVSLEKARERANELTSAARAGRDLIAEEEESRAAAASRLTVQQLIELYIRRRVTGRLRTALDIERRLTRALAPILNRYADDIRRRDIRELLDAVADQGIEREAEKRRQTVGAMFRWALSQDIVEMDPTAGLKAYDPGTPRDRVLTVAEIEVLWKWLDSNAVPPDPAEILKLQLLTGARCGEISGLCAEEIDREEWNWTLPAARSKNKRPRVTPLLGAARQIIEARLSTVQSGALFLAETGTVLTAAHIGHYLLARSDKLPISKFTTHDLRRTVATMLVEMGITLDLVAAVVGHEAGTKETRTLVRHYVRTDLIEGKVRVLRAWDERLQGIVAGREAERVVRLRKAG
jgi:integrase